MVQLTKNIEMLIEEGGEMTLGGMPPSTASPRPLTMPTGALPCSCAGMAKR